MKNKVDDLRFDNTYPVVGKDNLFSNRYEVSQVLKDVPREFLAKKIKKLLLRYIAKREIIATTYFEPILNFKPNQRCVVRFRQRKEFNSTAKFNPPETWTLYGSGNLEIKIRNDKTKHVIKMGSFLPQKKEMDLYSLMKLAQTKRISKNAITNFISYSNDKQIKSTKSITKASSLINPEILFKVARFLVPQITRVNLRETFEPVTPSGVKITLESYPAFYPYSITHKVFDSAPYKPKYKGYLVEHSKKIKVEIKTTKLSEAIKIEKTLLLGLKKNKVEKHKYAETSYPNMIMKASEENKVFIHENTGKEMEAKANIHSKVDLYLLIKRLRSMIINDKGSNYRIFLSDPDVNTRTDKYSTRTIFGWKDELNNWHEVVTVNRLKKGSNELGYLSVLKWKSDLELTNNNVLNRDEKKDFLKRNISNKGIIKMARLVVNKKIQLIGTFKKIKHRIIIQNKDGRNFIVSLDESRFKNSTKILKQLEVEYKITIQSNNGQSKDKLEVACDKCMNYIVSLFKKLNIKIERTNLRKIDFISLQNNN